MKITIIYAMVKMLYANFLRELVVKAVQDTESEIDDFFLELLDRLLEYKE